MRLLGDASEVKERQAESSVSNTSLFFIKVYVISHAEYQIARGVCIPHLQEEQRSGMSISGYRV